MMTDIEKKEALVKAVQDIVDAGDFVLAMGVALSMAEELVRNLSESHGEDIDLRDTTINTPSGRLVTFHKLDTPDGEVAH